MESQASQAPISSACVSDTKPSDWRYVAEGGATIVFSYVGRPRPQFDGKVLRLRKVVDSQTPEETLSDEPDDPSIEFQQKVIARIVPEQYLPMLKSAHVDRAWLEELATLHDPCRPLERRQKDKIDTERRKAVVATDLIGGNGLAVEIKPKWGFLPNLTYLSCETLPIKSTTCRFCMHTHLRSTRKGETVSQLRYCPMDLFSGNEDRMTKAVDDLWDSWLASRSAINNLRISVNGKMIKPDVHADDSFLVQTLSPMELQTLSLTELRKSFTSSVVGLLMSTPVLQILSKLQRTLDSLDIEGLSRLRQMSKTDSISTGVDIPEPTIGDWTNFLNTYLDESKCSRDRNSMEFPDASDVMYHMYSYLLSATFKDCSIILRLPHLCTSKENTGTVTIIDLDPKPMRNLQKWEKLDREIVEKYSSVRAEDRRRCVDSMK